MFVFWNPCELAKLRQQKRALKLCSATSSDDDDDGDGDDDSDDDGVDDAK